MTKKRVVMDPAAPPTHFTKEQIRDAVNKVMTIGTVNLKISCCDKCPNWKSERYYTEDSFETVFAWICKAHPLEPKQIALQDWNDPPPKIPKWYPLREKE